MSEIDVRGSTLAWVLTLVICGAGILFQYLACVAYWRWCVPAPPAHDAHDVEEGGETKTSESRPAAHMVMKAETNEGEISVQLNVHHAPPMPPPQSPPRALPP